MTITVTHAKVSGIADDPAASAAGEVLPSDWNAIHVVTGVTPILSGDTSFYVATTGSDTTGDGSVGAPWKTLQFAFDEVFHHDLAGFTATIQVADGTYVGIFLAQERSNLSGFFTINGNVATPGNVIITPPFSVCFDFEGSINIILSNLVCQGGGRALSQTGALAAGATVTIDLINVSFINLAVICSFDAGIHAGIAGTWSITGDFLVAVDIARGSIVSMVSPTLVGTPDMSIAFTRVDIQSIITIFNPFVGSATGVRFIVSNGSVISTGTNNLTYIPGNQPGVIGPGGQYDKFPEAFFTDTIDNILVVPPVATIPAYASDLGVNLISDGTQWNINTSYFVPQADAHDIGAEEFSNRIGYGKTYVTDKSLSNCAIGFGSVSNPMDGQLRHFLNTFFNTEVLQIYQNGEWETLPANVTLRDNQAAQRHALEHFPLTNTWIRTFSGDSELVGLNGRSIVQGYQVDLGAYPGIQQLNGGTF